MPTIEEKIEASKAIEAELLSQLLALPGAEVVDEKGYDLLHSMQLQRETTWKLGGFVGEKHFGLSGCGQLASAPITAEQAVSIGAISPDDYQKLADTYTAGPAPEPEPPTLVATEPPAPPAEAPAPEAPVAEPV